MIDPVLTYSSHFGGGGDPGDAGTSVALDAAGFIYVAGSTNSSSFSPHAGAIQTAAGGGTDAFLMKLDASGTAVLFATYLGGSGYDQALDLAVDAAGSAYLTGTTSSADFPLTQGVLAQNQTGGLDGFVAKLSASGNALAYSTYVGGAGTDALRSIAVSASGEATVAGFTESTDFPVTSGVVQGALRGATDAVIARLNAAGSAFLYSTYLGGSQSDRAFALAIDAGNNAYVAGSTFSQDFPVTGGAAQTVPGGGQDAFLAKVDAGGALVYSTYLGGEGDEEAWGLAVDGSGAAHLTGYTASDGFPTTSGAGQTTCAGYLDAFASKFAPSGGTLVYSTYLGGARSDFGEGIALDAAGNAHITGGTRSKDFPLTGNAFQRAHAGHDDAFVAQFSPAGALGHASYLGGTGEDRGLAIAVDGAGWPLVTGFTSSADFPVSPGGLRTPPAESGARAFLIRTGVAATVADLEVAIAVTPATVAPGLNATYRVTVTNRGPADAAQVRLSDVLPSSMDFVSCRATGGGVCEGAGNARRVVFSTLSAGGSEEVTLEATFNTALKEGTPVVNTVAVTSDVPDADLGANYASVTATAGPPESVSTPLKPSGPAKVNAGTAYSYSTAAATSNHGHPLQYRFEWGGGTDSGWLPAGTRTAQKSWSSPGNYSVRVRARCAIHTDKVSSLSPALAVTAGYPISGRVTLPSGTGIASVKIALSGSETRSMQTDGSGGYAFAGLRAGGTYTVKPSKTGYVFTPVSRTVSNLNTGQAAGFTGTARFTISGRISTSAGAAIVNAKVVLSGSKSMTALTNSNGRYSFAGLTAGRNYTVKPSKSGYVFTPASRSYTGLNANQTANFTGAR